MSYKKLIVFEGLDGVGKTKFSTLLKDFLSQNNINVSLWPIDSHYSITKKEQECPQLSFKYYLESLEKRIVNNTSEFIIFDRYIASALGYRLLRNNKMNINKQELLELDRLYNKLCKPDITFLLTAPNDRRKQNILLKENIDSYDKNSLSDKNTLFWNGYYESIADESFSHINTDCNENNVLKNLIQIVKN